MPVTPTFVHLRLHSEYSIVDSTLRVDDAVAAASADAMPALAITDLATLFGAVKFYRAARSRGVKPLIGVDAWVADDRDRDLGLRALFLCRSHTGYLRLCDWLTRAYRTQHHGRPEIRREWIAADSGGLIAIAGGPGSDIGAALAQGNTAHAEELARWWAMRFPDAFYLEVQRRGAPHEDALVAATADLAAGLGLPVVATHPVQFLRRSDFRGHEARVCIAEGQTLADPRRSRAFTDGQYFTTQAEMGSRFADMPEALANGVEIARRCNIAIPLGKSFLPEFPTPAGESLDSHLRRESLAGLDARLARLFPDGAERERVREEYETRLDFEIRTIVQMGFPGYFLIVADFINWAKKNGVPVGPGRGSGAGSLVAYSLGITDLDPLRYQLLFERFLNPERISMPDFDIDFCQDGRDRVIEYVKQRYGAESVSQIATFGTMAAKAAVRDVGRVLDLPYPFVDGIAKLIPFQPGKTITLAMAREMEPVLAERERQEEEVRELLVLAEQLEGLTRNVGMHAGGVLIAPGRLTDFCALYAQPGALSMVSQYDKDDVEAIGLVKFDFLGLTTLTIIDWTLRFIRELDPASTLDLDRLPLDDPQTFALFGRADTSAVFQFESRGMRDLLKQARPDRLEDLIALNALYRPGPMDLIPDFIARKHGRERVEYLDARLEPILGPTYGIMVYQEQVMQIAQVIAGYSLGSADILRRAMGKKKPDEMATQREIFLAGAVANGLSAQKATTLFDLMEKFAGYGFNKSHSAAYALVAYQTAWLKVHHAAAFMAANLSLVMDDTDKVRALVDDAQAQGLEILPPDVNESGYRFQPIDRVRVRYGLGGVKGTGEAAITSIVAARAVGGRYADLFEFCRRVDKRLVNRRVVEALVRAGAFDGLDANRAALLACVPIALEGAEQAERDLQQSSLFGDEGSHAAVVPRVETKPWGELERLQNEKSALGFYLSGHPFRAWEAEVSALTRTRLDQLQPRREPALIAGVVIALRTQIGRRGKMAFVTLDDGRAQVEVMVYNEVFDANRALLAEDILLVAEVRVSQRLADNGEAQGLRIIAEALYDIDRARRKFARALHLNCNGGSSSERLLRALEPYRNGSCPIRITYRNEHSSGELELPEPWRVTLDDKLVSELRSWLEPANVEVIY